jgi:hypothetical protein
VCNISFSACINGTKEADEDDGLEDWGVASDGKEEMGIDGMVGGVGAGCALVFLIRPSAMRLPHVDDILAMSVSTFIVANGSFCWPEKRRERMGWA